MKAILYSRYGPPDVLEAGQASRPHPKPRELLIRVRAAVVTPADCAAREPKKLVERLAFGVFGPRNLILGTEFSGTVEDPGKQVTRFRKGDQVFAATGANFGAHCEYVCLAEDGAVAIKPENLTFAQAAALCDGGLTALPFLRDLGKIAPGRKVLINGASGAVGNSAVQLAKYFGAHVTGVCSAANLEMVRNTGADEVMDYTREDFTERRDAFDIIFDAVGNRSFSACKSALSPHGTYLTTKPSLAILGDALRTSRRQGKRARIMFAGLRPAKEKAKDLALLKELAESGSLNPVIDKCYPAEEIAEAHRHVETGHKKGSVVVHLD